jgi:putative flippase GtrA
MTIASALTHFSGRPVEQAMAPRALSPAFAKLGGESARYLVASVVALAVDVAVYTLLVQAAVVPSGAGAAGYLVGLLVHYRLSAGWVFRGGDRRVVPTLAKFAVSGLIGLLTTAAIIAALTMSGLAGALVAKAIAVVVSFVAVFLIRRIYVFAARPEAAR